MRSTVLTTATLCACVVLAGCSAKADDRPVVHIAPAAAPVASRAIETVLPTPDDLKGVLDAGGFMGQLVVGGPDMLLAGVGQGDATPADCAGAGYSLQRVVYPGGPVRSVASRSWAGGTPDGPTATGFFGAVSFTGVDEAKAFFADSAAKWHGCNGQTMVVNQPQRGAPSSSAITDVTVEPTVLSAVVMRDAGGSVQRALGLAGDCVVDVEVTHAAAAGATDAIGVANLMLHKVAAS